MPRPRDSTNLDPEQLVRFGKSLRRARTKAGLSQLRLGELARVSQGEVSLFERGQREPGLLTVVKLARALHITTAELVADLN